uniref:Uncharacterized protein n=1 Tax=Panagrolaimus sp. JU765 TaxID=591449 RepID=A0AC34R2D1_9BILA
MEEEFETSLTVTIALDESGSASKNDALPIVYRIDPPPKPTEACPLPPPNIKVKDLGYNAEEILDMRLNPPAIGSMKNWEHVSADLGIQNTSYWRNTCKNPVKKLLEQMANRELKDLIVAIGKIGRIDVLLSLRPFVEGIEASKHALCTEDSINDSAMFDSTSDSTTSPERAGFTMPTKDFILVTSHILRTKDNQSLRGTFKLFISVLKKIAKENGMNVLNLDECVDDSNLYLTTDLLFIRAKQIVLFCSLDYCQQISDVNVISLPDSSPQINIKRYLHRLTNEEFMRNNSRVTRFKLASPNIFAGKVKDYFSGWPTVTLEYQFETVQQMMMLCNRLFGKEKK